MQALSTSAPADQAQFQWSYGPFVIVQALAMLTLVSGRCVVQCIYLVLLPQQVMPKPHRAPWSAQFHTQHGRTLQQDSQDTNVAQAEVIGTLLLSAHSQNLFLLSWLVTNEAQTHLG